MLLSRCENPNLVETKMVPRIPKDEENGFAMLYLAMG